MSIVRIHLPLQKSIPFSAKMIVSLAFQKSESRSSDMILQADGTTKSGLFSAGKVELPIAATSIVGYLLSLQLASTATTPKYLDFQAPEEELGPSAAFPTSKPCFNDQIAKEKP